MNLKEIAEIYGTLVVTLKMMANILKKSNIELKMKRSIYRKSHSFCLFFSTFGNILVKIGPLVKNLSKAT